MFAQLLFKAIAGVITQSLVLLLQAFRKNNGETKYNQLREALRNSFLLLKSEVEKTKTKVDDTAVQLFLDAIDQADQAGENSVTS